MSNPSAYRELPWLNECGKPVIVCTFMRSGTHLLLDLIHRHFPEFRSWKWPWEPLSSRYLAVDVLLPQWQQKDWGIDHAKRILRRPRRPLIKTHFTTPGFQHLSQAYPDLAAWLNKKGAVLYVVRNPIKAIPSTFALYQTTHPETKNPPDTWVRQEAKRWAHHVNRWSSYGEGHRLKFEELISNPETCLDRIQEVIGARLETQHPLHPPRIRSKWHGRWLRVCTWRPESTEILTSRPPLPPETFWTPSRVEILKKETGATMGELGYTMDLS